MARGKRQRNEDTRGVCDRMNHGAANLAKVKIQDPILIHLLFLPRIVLVLLYEYSSFQISYTCTTEVLQICTELLCCIHNVQSIQYPISNTAVPVSSHVS